MIRGRPAARLQSPAASDREEPQPDARRAPVLGKPEILTDTQPQFLLLSPPLDDPAFSAEGFPLALDRLLEGLGDPLAAGVSALLLRDGALGDDDLLARIAMVAERAQTAGIAVILENRSDLLAASGCDGVHMTVAEKGSTIRKLRQQLGKDLVIGAGCGGSRHAAMLAGEQGADYVGFGAVDGTAGAEPALVDWWVRDMTPPLVAFGARSLAEARSLAAAGADFVAVPPDIWQESGDPAAVFRALSDPGGTAD